MSAAVAVESHLEEQPAYAPFLDRIRGALRKSVEGILTTGDALIDAKETLPHGAFTELLRMVGIQSTTARQLMAIARHPGIRELANRHNSGGSDPERPSTLGILPATVSGLHELSRREPEDVKRVAGFIRDGMTCDEIKALFGGRVRRKRKVRAEKPSRPFLPDKTPEQVYRRLSDWLVSFELSSRMDFLDCLRESINRLDRAPIAEWSRRQQGGESAGDAEGGAQ